MHNDYGRVGQTTACSGGPNCKICAAERAKRTIEEKKRAELKAAIDWAHSVSNAAILFTGAPLSEAEYLRIKAAFTAGIEWLKGQER